jgi:hypothetical protein
MSRSEKRNFRHEVTFIPLDSLNQTVLKAMLCAFGSQEEKISFEANILFVSQGKYKTEDIADRDFK